MKGRIALWACSRQKRMPNNLPAYLATVGLRPPSTRYAINRNLNHKKPPTINRLETYHNKWTEKVDSGRISAFATDPKNAAPASAAVSCFCNFMLYLL
jgi:hypothetical protein